MINATYSSHQAGRPDARYMHSAADHGVIDVQHRIHVSNRSIAVVQRAVRPVRGKWRMMLIPWR